MRKESREDAIARANSAEADAFAFQRMLIATMTGDAPLLCTVHYDGWTVRLYANDLDRCDGGYVAIRSDCKGQKPYVTAHNAPKYIAMLEDSVRISGRFNSADGPAFAKLLETLRVAMNKAQAA